MMLLNYQRNLFIMKDQVKAGPSKLTVNDPNDVARTTIKETNIHNNHNGNLNGPKINCL